MKLKVLYQTGACALVVAGAVSLCVSLLSSQSDERQLVGSDFPFAAVSPEVPEVVTFADDTVYLDRMDLRERMDREQNAFAYMHSTTMLAIKRANRYFPVIEPILKQEGVPDDFKYLAVIESSLDEWARSAAKACGMWQFMEETGREYGLEVNANVDERFNLEKATRAACRYLKDAYARYGDWLTVAASYNAGQGRISRELERQGVDRAADLWLNPETSRYMFRLLAVKEVFSNPKRFGFCLKRHQLYPPVKYRYVEVDTAIHSLADFAREQKVLLRQLKEANPWLRDYTLHNRSRKLYRIAVPDSASIYYNPQSTPVHDTAWVID